MKAFYTLIILLVIFSLFSCDNKIKNDKNLIKTTFKNQNNSLNERTDTIRTKTHLWQKLDYSEIIQPFLTKEMLNNQYTGKGTFIEIIRPSSAHYYGYGAVNIDTIIYSGEWKNGKKHGNGSWQVSYPWKSGQRIIDFYKGEWKLDKRNGKGIASYANTCEKYEGEWADDNFIDGIISDCWDGYKQKRKYKIKDGKKVSF